MLMLTLTVGGGRLSQTDRTTVLVVGCPTRTRFMADGQTCGHTGPELCLLTTTCCWQIQPLPWTGLLLWFCPLLPQTWPLSVDRLCWRQLMDIYSLFFVRLFLGLFLGCTCLVAKRRCKRETRCSMLNYKHIHTH